MNVSGEAVFTTSLVGYPESMTDPSYRGQILVFTTPLIGNYGVPSKERDEYGLLKYFESPHIQCAGVVVSDIATQYSHWTAVTSLSEWCAREGVPIISGVDTRAIVTFLREQGSTLARISVGESYDEDEDAGYMDPEQQHLVSHVSTKAPFLVESEGASLHVALLDCGVKENILRSLVARGASVTVFPFDYPIHKVSQHFDGVFISNGPGDPTHCVDTVQNLRRLMDTSRIPIMGSKSNFLLYLTMTMLTQTSLSGSPADRVVGRRPYRKNALREQSSEYPGLGPYYWSNPDYEPESRICSRC